MYFQPLRYKFGHTNLSHPEKFNLVDFVSIFTFKDAIFV